MSHDTEATSRGPDYPIVWAAGHYLGDAANEAERNRAGEENRRARS